MVDTGLGLLVQIAPDRAATPQDDATMVAISEAVDAADTPDGDPRPALVHIKTMLTAVVKIEASKVSAQSGRASWWGAGGRGPPQRGL